MSPKCKDHKKGERQSVHMHYLPFGARLNKGILMVTQLILVFSAHLNQRELLPLDFLFFIQGVFHLFTVILFRTFHSFSCGNFVYVSFCTQIVLRNNAYSNVNISFRKFFTYGYFLSHCSRSSIIALSPGILNIPARPFLISFVAFFADTNDILCPSS